jgi:hypothetical protein
MRSPRFIGWILAGALGAASPPASGPISWDVQITVSARGEYGLEGPEVRVDGRYGFTVVWTGALYVDDEDFLLVHGGTKVESWTAEEKALRADKVTVLATNDFPDCPELKVNYVLRKQDGLHLDFIVRGFDVPLGEATESFYLHLPASAENGENPGGLKYNLSVVSGSNAVVVDERKIQKGPAEETFRWLWKRREWIQRRDQTILETNSHAVEAKVVLTAKNETPARA